MFSRKQRVTSFCPHITQKTPEQHNTHIQSGLGDCAVTHTKHVAHSMVLFFTLHYISVLTASISSEIIWQGLAKHCMKYLCSPHQNTAPLCSFVLVLQGLSCDIIPYFFISSLFCTKLRCCVNETTFDEPCQIQHLHFFYMFTDLLYRLHCKWMWKIDVRVFNKL